MSSHLFFYLADLGHGFRRKWWQAGSHRTSARRRGGSRETQIDSCASSGGHGLVNERTDFDSTQNVHSCGRRSIKCKQNTHVGAVAAETAIEIGSDGSTYARGLSSCLTTTGFAVMRLLVVCVFIIGLGILLLLGLWAMANELYSNSTFGVPFEADGKSPLDYADEEQSASSSATPVG
jgi:hypothetical protein